MLLETGSNPIAARSIETQLEGLSELWSQTLGDPRICIAVLDGPVDLTHPSIANASLTQIDIDDVRDSKASLSDHGTHVTSIIFGDHSSPVKGVAPQCRGLIVPIFRYAQDGSLESCSQQRLAKAIRAAARHGANVINISGGQITSQGEASPELRAAIEECGKDVLIVAAAGNDGCDCLHVPGALPSVLAVGAMNAEGQPLPFSNWGEAYRSQGILAPGEHIVGASSDGGVRTQSGTSFSTPVVSGVAGLLLSLQQKLGIVPNSTNIRNAILQTTHGCDPQTETQCERVLAGRLSISGTVSVVTRGENIMQNATNNPAPAETVVPTTLETVQPTATDVDSVEASACCEGCAGGSKQFVYAIGELNYDFPSVLRERSVQQNMDHILAVPGHVAQVRNSLDFLRHLFGFKEVFLPEMNIGDVDSVEVKSAIYLLKVQPGDGKFRLKFTRSTPSSDSTATAEIPVNATEKAIRDAIKDHVLELSDTDINVIEKQVASDSNDEAERAREFAIEFGRSAIAGELVVADDASRAHATIQSIGRLRMVVSDGAVNEDDVHMKVGFNGIAVGTKDAKRPSVLNTAKAMTVSHIHHQDSDGRQVIYVNSDVVDESDDISVEEAHFYIPRKCQVTAEHNSNMFDASAVIWKLNRGHMEVYGIVPDGNFSEAVYEELAEFYMNQCGLTKAGLTYYYYEKAGRMLPWEFHWDPSFNDPQPHINDFTDPDATSLMQDPSERVAIPGVLSGEVRLLTGVTLPAIKPDMRGTAEWSQSRMLDILVAEVKRSSNVDVSAADQKLVSQKIKTILERLDDAVRNPGISPEDRALNHAATRLFAVLGEVAGELVTNEEASVGQAARTYELENIVVHRSEIGYAGSDCWDVEVSFFNPVNDREALVVVAQTIDVNDTIPALTDKPRKFRRR